MPNTYFPPVKCDDQWLWVPAPGHIVPIIGSDENEKNQLWFFKVDRLEIYSEEK